LRPLLAAVPKQILSPRRPSRFGALNGHQNFPRSGYSKKFPGCRGGVGDSVVVRVACAYVIWGEISGDPVITIAWTSRKRIGRRPMGARSGAFQLRDSRRL
jgi:hypothetical protein